MCYKLLKASLFCLYLVSVKQLMVKELEYCFKAIQMVLLQPIIMEQVCQNKGWTCWLTKHCSK